MTKPQKHEVDAALYEIERHEQCIPAAWHPARTPYRRSMEWRLRQMTNIAWCLGGLFFVTFCLLAVVLMTQGRN